VRAPRPGLACLPRPSAVSEKKISGGLTFLTHTHLIVGVHGEG
jgi:hypothetical protein